MAEGTINGTYTSNILCRYFVHGVCKAADHCPYSHDLHKDKPSMVCRFYQRGACSYGDRCRYDHVKPPSESKTQHNNQRKGSGKNKVTTPSPTIKPLMTPTIGDKDKVVPHLVTLKKQTGESADSGLGEETTSPGQKDPSLWVKAAEFVPGQTWKGMNLPGTYSEAALTGTELSGEVTEPSVENPSEELCPFAAHGECRYGENCVYHHGDICDMCGCAALHQHNPELREQHKQECLKAHEKDMELSFAIQRSQEKSCGICMEVVWDKEPQSKRKFGILSSCSHVFCLECIRKWRSAKSFENKIIRACPECRVKSDFIVPSKYWAEDEASKQELIQGYKEALSKKNCKYFNQGKGQCPFNENCFYLHAYPDGRKASPKPPRRRRRANADGDIDLLPSFLLWDFLEFRSSSMHHLFDEDDLSDIILHLNLLGWSSDDESESSDFEF